MARHGSGRRNGLSGRTKKLDSELWQQDVDQQNGTRGSFRFPPDRRHQKRTTDVLRKPDNCKSYRQFTGAQLGGFNSELRKEWDLHMHGGLVPSSGTSNRFFGRE